jgi:hypothetical protein
MLLCLIFDIISCLVLKFKVSDNFAGILRLEEFSHSYYVCGYMRDCVTNALPLAIGAVRLWFNV